MSASTGTTLNDVLRTQWEGLPALRLESPPGAGKTWSVEALAAQAFAMGERCMIVTTTRAQSNALAERLSRRFTRVLVYRLVSRSARVGGASTYTVISDFQNIPTGPCVAVATAAKWMWCPGDGARFDLMLVDEAFQLPAHAFYPLVGLARRMVLIGDPGQIPPVIESDIAQWRDDPAGPHVPAPDAMLARFPDLPRRHFTTTRRLPASTVELVQPTFYPELPFEALHPEGFRGLTCADPGVGSFGEAIARAVQGQSVQMLTLPSRVVSIADPEMARAMVGMTRHLLARQVGVREGDHRRLLLPEDVGVVCAHVAQVTAIRRALPRGVLVETADRFQGLEREVMLVHHPLSSASRLTPFHYELGRMNVMLTRHRTACFVFARSGLSERLVLPPGDRYPGQARDRLHEGWSAHHGLLGALSRGRLSIDAARS